MKLAQYVERVQASGKGREVNQLLELAGKDSEVDPKEFLTVLQIADKRFGQLNGEVVPTTPRWQ